MHHRLFPFAILALCIPVITHAQTTEPDTSPGDKMIAEYFRFETQRLQGTPVKDVKTLEDWTDKRDTYRSQLLEMLGLDPMPERTDLKPTVTGRVEHAEFTVEKLHYQSRPGLYVTGNLYLPKNVSEKLPAILYVCGHGRVKKDGVSYGNKVHYHHHGSWFARNGYVCLTIDTLQLGEIEGVHHGTYREKMWWWLNRGYTPAGVEAWNCVRALDYLQSRPEVDGDRIGVTGRSGGGAYSWWIAAIDDRIKCAVPVAGITDLQNHVYDGQSDRFPDGCVEGHCDCMFMVNTHRWDYPMVAAMVAPRPLMISNTDSDSIFPLDGVYRTFADSRKIYSLYGKPENIALNIEAGGHSDTQQLRVSAFAWLNKHLKGKSEPINQTAEKFFEPEQLRVLTDHPSDQLNTEIHETFVNAAQPPSAPDGIGEWEKQRDHWMSALRSRTFAGWPTEPGSLEMKEAFQVDRQGLSLRAIDFTSQNAVRLRLFVLQKSGAERPDLVVLNPVGEMGWQSFLGTLAPAFADKLPTPETKSESDFDATKKMVTSFNWAMAWIAPRGIGLTRWNQSEKKQTQHRRRFYLLGQSLDGMRVYDVRRAMQVLRQDGQLKHVPLWLQAEGTMCGIATYASLFEPPVARIDLHKPTTSHRNGPFLLNVRRFLDMPQAIAMAAAKSRTIVYQQDSGEWEFVKSTMRATDKQKNFQVREPR